MDTTNATASVRIDFLLDGDARWAAVRLAELLNHALKPGGAWKWRDDQGEVGATVEVMRADVLRLRATRTTVRK